MPRVAWITGAGGLIGSHLLSLAPKFAPGWHVRGLTREGLDLCDTKAVRQAFEADRPQLIIHCAALSRSPVCQSQPALAWQNNVEVTEVLAGLAERARFCFFSTDLVFDGREGRYRESAPVQPLSVYGETKAAAEQVVLRNPRHTVIRTSLNGGPSPTGDRGFNEQLRLAWKRGESCRLFTDEFRSPIPASATARAVWEMVAQELSGVYHLAGAERLSRWQIGQLIAARCPELHPQIQAASLKEYHGAPRPPDTSLDSSKLQATLSFQLPGLTEWLQAHPDEVF